MYAIRPFHRKPHSAGLDIDMLMFFLSHLVLPRYHTINMRQAVAD